MLEWITGVKYIIYKKYLVYQGKKKSKAVQQETMTFPIDFVVTWVDGNDSEWLREKQYYAEKSNLALEKSGNGEERYREWDNFKYWFRAVEKYAPWVRKVFLVTYGHIPEWINTNASKLEIVKHTEFIPQKYLPTFNSNPIELNIHRIEGLSEHFVYFNDDFFLNREVYPEDFFRNGYPNYTVVARPLINMTNSAFEHMQFSTLSIINKKYGDEISKRIGINPEKWFSDEYGKFDIECNLYAYDKNYLPGMWFSHLGVALRKSTMKKVWEENESLLNETSLCRFRQPQNIIHQVFSLYEILEGEFNSVGRSHHGKVFSAQMENLKEMEEALISEKYRMICINDNELLSEDNYQIIKERIKVTFEKVLPFKSEYEK